LFKQATLQLDDPNYDALAEATFERFLEDERRTPTQRPEFQVGALVNLAFIDRKHHKLARALERLEEARRLGLDDMTFRLNRGMILAELGKLDEAIADLQASEALGPAGEWSWWVPYQAALVYARAGDDEHAIAACQRSIENVSALAASSGMYGPTV